MARRKIVDPDDHYTIEYITALLDRKDRVGMHAVGRALVVLFNRQTEDEKRTKTTREYNERGFMACHAECGSAHARIYLDTGLLSTGHLAFWQGNKTDDPKKKTRIQRYVRQILDAALEKREKLDKAKHT